MPRIIGQNRIPRVNIGNRNINSRPGGGGPAALLSVFDFNTPGVSSYTLPFSGTVSMFVFGGGGGSGVDEFGDMTWSGSGGGAAFRAVQLSKGMILTVTVAAPGPFGTTPAAATNGFPSSVSWPGGVLSAEGGQFTPINRGGNGLNGEVNRRGAAGVFGYINGLPSPDPGGGAGGIAGATGGGGSGGGGFGDIATLLKGGDGFSALTPVGGPYGGGAYTGQGSPFGVSGGRGRVVISISGVR